MGLGLGAPHRGQQFGQFGVSIGVAHTGWGSAWKKSRHPDAGDLNALLRLAVLSAAAWANRCVADVAQRVVACAQLAKGGVLAVEEVCIAKTDKKLAAGGVRIGRSGHRDDTANMWTIVELGLDRMAGTAGAPEVFERLILGLRVAALDHESGHDTVKASAIVKPIVGQLGEVCHRAGGDIGLKFYGYFPLGGLDSRVWICVFAHVKACISQIVRCDRQWGIFRVMPG